jgi:hypothetical protein
VKRTACQRCHLQIRGSWRLNHCMHTSRRRGVSGFPTCGRYALIPNYLSLFRSLSTYMVVMCSWRRYGSFYSCSCLIAEIRKSHKAALSGNCDT